MIARPLLTTLELNAIGAALNERTIRLGANLIRLQEMPASRSRDEAIEATEDGIRDAIRAMTILEDAATAEEEPSAPMFEGMGDYTEAELRSHWGDR